MIEIRALFLDYLVSLFDNFDESKHFDFTQKNNIFKEKEFINDSRPELKTLVSLIVKLPVFKSNHSTLKYSYIIS